ncbi:MULTISPECIES: DUF4350 domain-containing protein [unclassified Microbulbifer]|uniref:DUF4350 domain-containing protein n=1 Tax=unclassified Microbulbifer TaxID=2619833 RepID=UPI0027E4D60A|nr:MULTISPECIES: DUF4350 domain-containing protein [unclassified Microbulbifer]
MTRFLLAVSLLLTAATTAAFLYFFERYSEELDLGWGPEARRNPYLAAEQFLAADGLQTRRADNISVLNTLAPDDTLYLASSSQAYNLKRADELLGWVESGGHAIVVAHIAGEGERDWLLDRLEVSLEERDGIDFEHPFRELLGEEAEEFEGKSASEILREHNRRLREGEPEEKEESAEEEKPPRNPDVDPEDLVTLATEDGGEYRLHFTGRHQLQHPALEEEEASDGPVFWAKIHRDDTGVPFMQFERGDGLITIVADGGLWRSDRIGHFDHAYLLRLLASDGNFVFLTRPRFDSLGELARRYAGEFFLAGALALLAWLLYRSRRFGPRAPEPETARRSLLEHISACGHYYWRAGHCENLVRQQRDALLRRLGGERASPPIRRKLCTQLAAQTGLDESSIAATLWGDPPRSEETFTEQMRKLQQIEAAL